MRFDAYRKFLQARMETAVRTAAQRAAQTARGIVPVGDGKDGGHLRDHIFSSVSAAPGHCTGSVLADKHYAAYVEMGTSRMAPHPYLRPALRGHRDFFLRELSK